MERSLATADGAAAASPRITVTPLHTLPDGEHFGVKIQGLSLGALSEADWELVWVAWLKCEPPAQPNSTAVPDALLTVTGAAGISRPVVDRRRGGGLLPQVPTPRLHCRDLRETSPAPGGSGHRIGVCSCTN